MSALGINSDDSLSVVLVEYVQAVERGERPDRARMFASFPNRARELAEFFATRDRLDQLTAPLRTTGAVPQESETVGSVPDPAPGLGQIGDFRLLREVGRGGMGVVYEAEQLSLCRRVALKVLPFASALDPRHLQRFRNEAQAAAQLHHTHIVPVFAVGTERGVHYYAMQFIDGQSLAQLVSDLRAAEAPRSAVAVSSGGVTPLAGAVSAERAAHRRHYYRRIAGLVKQTAEALEYAHQVGVVHRDVKPANLMLDGGGRLWVTDFGLAQMRNDAGLTATGEVIGTARYMSPEQAAGLRGVVDHRTDIYSLGATLYELLTLAPVFDAEDGRALLYQVAYKEPRPPRAVDPSVPVELETVVLKALAKVPAERYATAQELADDLQRFLDDRPVLARRPSLRDRAAKWVRRHRAPVAAAVLGLALAVVGLGVSTVVIAGKHAEAQAAYQRERDANEREREQAREAAARRAEAEDNYDQARRTIDLFAALSEAEQLDFPTLIPIRYRLLQTAVTYYQELNDRRDDPAVRADLASSQARLARLLDELTALNDINTLLMLDQPVVRADLGITAEQASRLDPIVARYRVWPEGVGGKADRRPTRETAAAFREEVENCLTAAQYRRLQQLFLQAPGPHVFRPQTITALGVTDAKRDEIRRIKAEADRETLWRFAAVGTRDDSQTQFTQVWKRANSKIVELLTPDQRARWAEMVGPPVRGEVQFPLPSLNRTR